ncbi:MAG: hypothetical protein HY395_00180 [Candidatus Doudnabacteria bacterium]|nr:hypothetical protein [Candidatus Doudnabacteria bacterium]
MTNFLLKSIPPQSIKIYSFLEDGKSRTAKDIGKQLNIFPNAVYRAIRQLLELGFVRELEGYPIKYQAKSATDAMELYSLIMKQNFQDAFNAKNTHSNEKGLNMSFITTRKELLEQTKRDAEHTKNTFDHIVSGHEIPADSILAYKKSLERGVKIRIIVHQMPQKQMIESWKRMGVEIRYYPDIQGRIFIFDKRIIYFTSYNPKKKQEAIGMRFEYPPFALLMDELFEQKWKLGKTLT